MDTTERARELLDKFQQQHTEVQNRIFQSDDWAVLKHLEGGINALQLILGGIDNGLHNERPEDQQRESGVESVERRTEPVQPG